MALSTGQIIGIGAAVVGVGALLLSSAASSEPTTPTPDTPTPDPTAPEPTTVDFVIGRLYLTLSSLGVQGPQHTGRAYTDGRWRVATTQGVLVIEGKEPTIARQQQKLVDAWIIYTNGGTNGVLDGKVFHVREPGYAPAFPTRWAYGTDPSFSQGFVRHAQTRRLALTNAIARASAGDN